MSGTIVWILEVPYGVVGVDVLDLKWGDGEVWVGWWHVGGAFACKIGASGGGYVTS